MTRRKNDDPGEPGLDRDALAMGAYLLLVAGAVATGLTGSWVPMLGTIGAVGLAIRYANLRSKAK